MKGWQRRLESDRAVTEPFHPNAKVAQIVIARQSTEAIWHNPNCETTAG